MALLRKRKSKLLPLSLVIGIIISTSPIMDGCSHGGQEGPSASAPAAQPNATAASMASAQAPAAAPPAAAEPAAALAPPGPAPGTATPEQLQSLVSPIALYPDTLIAQILAASTYPTQVVEADRWVKENAGLKGDQLANAVNQQPWDPSVRSLTQFPPVLKTMSENLSWTSALGEAYYNQPQDVMNAIQVMRNRAMKAGTLKSSTQQKVEVQTVSAPPAEGGGQPAPQQVIVIQPAQPNTVYVPTYNPSTVYGAPVPPPPGYSGTEMLTAGIVSFGVGMLVGSLINSGNNNWSCNWGGGNVYYNRNVFISNSAYMRGRYPYPGYAGRPYPGYPAGRPYPGRPPYGGYPPGGRYPGYPGNYPRPAPYTGKPANYANIKPPTFPGAGTLPGKQKPGNRPEGARPGGGNMANRPPGTKPGGGNLANRPGGGNMANRPSGGNMANRPTGGKFAENRPQTMRPTTQPIKDPVRGFGSGGRGASGARNGAFGGYQPGGFAQEASNRGRASLGGGNQFRGGAGGGGRRGGGGGGRRR